MICVLLTYLSSYRIHLSTIPCEYKRFKVNVKVKQVHKTLRHPVRALLSKLLSITVLTISRTKNATVSEKYIRSDADFPRFYMYFHCFCLKEIFSLWKFSKNSVEVPLGYIPYLHQKPRTYLYSLSLLCIFICSSSRFWKKLLTEFLST